MQYLNIGLLQFDQIWENKTRNFQKILSILKDKKEIDLLLLPEMFHTGFTMNIEMTETMINSEGIDFLEDLSKEKQCAIFTSLIIEEKDHFFNRGVFIQPDEQVIIYDKRKTFGLAGEDKIFSRLDLGGHFRNRCSNSNLCATDFLTINLEIHFDDINSPELIFGYEDIVAAAADIGISHSRRGS